MVYLGGPRGRRRPITGRGIYLHDPPPGYHPPRPHVPEKDRRRLLRRESILLRVLTIVLILTAAAVVAMIGLAIATYS
jgi:hypothetical protein